MRKTSKAVKYAFIFFIIMMVAAFFDGFIFSVLDGVIGEEGYVPYDPLMSGGSYTPSLWSIGEPSKVTSSAGVKDNPNHLTIQNRGGDLYMSGIGQTSNTLPRLDANADPYCYRFGVGGSQYYCAPSTYMTENLYLVDFKATITGSRPDIQFAPQNANIAIGSVTIPLSVDPLQKEKASIELRWDDYELGHYQVFKNDLLVGEGTGKDVRLVISSGNMRAGIPADHIVENPRVLRLFSCDPQEGERLVDACVGGPKLLKRDDLPGWTDGESSFCLNLPATRVKDGLASSSKRVYYELAQDGVIAIEENEVWRFQYLTDGGSEDVITIGSLCEEQTVEDTFDLEDYQFSLGPQELGWTTSKESRTLFSGNNELFTTSVPRYSCQETDNHDSTGDFVRYPEPQESCWSINVNDEKDIGSTYRTIEPFQIKLVNLQALYKYELGDDDDRTVTSWAASYKIKLSQDLATITKVTATNDELLVEIQNDYDDFKGSVSVIYRPQVINQDYVETTVGTIEKGKNVIRVPVPQGFSGDYEYDVSVQLLTDAGSLDASPSVNGAVSTEAVTDGGAVTTTATGTSGGSASNDAPWYVRFWEWIKGLF